MNYLIDFCWGSLLFLSLLSVGRSAVGLWLLNRRLRTWKKGREMFMRDLGESRRKSGIFVRKGSEYLTLHLCLLCFLLSFIVVANSALAQDVEVDMFGDPLPATIPLSTYERVKANDKLDPDGPLNHWTHAGRYAALLEEMLEATVAVCFGPVAPAPVYQPAENIIVCSRGEKSWRGDGSVWKPISEGIGNGRPVAILPCDYNGATVEVYHNAQRISGSRSRNYCKNPNAKNPDGRAHFDINTMARDLPTSPSLQLVTTFPDGSTECRQIPNPNNRQE